MIQQKFKAVTPYGLSDAFTLQEAIQNKTHLPHIVHEYIQYMGIADANHTDVYEGDILELKITEELMNHETDSFFNSNLGKTVEKEGDISSILLVFNKEHTRMSTPYELYFVRTNGKINRDDNNTIESEAIGEDSLFPCYLCNKGAIVIGNQIAEPNFLQKF